MADEKASNSTEEQVIDFRQVGATGLRRFSGFIYEEFLQELTGWKGVAVFKEMADNDAAVGAVLFAIDKLVRKVPWRIQPASEQPYDVEAAEFLEQCMDDMDETWIDTISEILSMLTYGYSVHEINYKRRCGAGFDPTMRSKYSDGRIGWRGFPIRSQDSIYRWQFDDHGGIQGVEQLAPPHYYHVTIPIEKMLLFRTTSQKNNPEGRSILRSAYRCFSEDTDILTNRGWVKAGEVTKDDQVATLSAAGEIEFQYPTETWTYEHKGEMILAQSRFVDQLVTPNHRMWVRRAHKETFEFIEASECNPTVNFKANGTWTSSGLKTVTIAGHEIDADLWFQFMGIYLAEGHCSGGKGRGYEVGLTQKTGKTKEWIEALLKRLPWEFSECDSKGNDVITFRCYRQELFEELSKFGKSKTKTIPRYILEGSAAQLELFLRAYHLGDGTNSGSYDKYDGTDLIYTSSEAMADDLMEAAFKAGYRPTKRWKEPTGFGGGVWSVVLGKAFEQLRASWSSVEYHGLVHCVTTQNGVVYCRRNGKSSWSGNSWYMKKNIENIEAIGIERDLAGLPMATVPPDLLSQNASQQQKALLSEIKQMVTNVRRDEQEGLVFPAAYDASGNKLYDFKLLSTGGSRQFDTDKIINRYDQRILMSALADFLLIGHQNVGSFSLVSARKDLFATAIGAFLDIIAATFNRFAVTRLFELNDFQISDYPKIVHGDLESVDLEVLGKYINILSNSGMPLFPDEELEKYLRQIAHLPEGLAKVKDIDQQVEPKHRVPPDQIKEIDDNPLQMPTGLDQPADTTPVNNKPPVATVTTNELGNAEQALSKTEPRVQSPAQFTNWAKW